MIDILTYIPEKLLPVVKSIWCLRVSKEGNTHYTEDILPDGHHEIIFHLEEKTARRSNDATNWITEPDAFFAGQTLKNYSLELQRNSLLYGIRFHPHTLNLLFKFPVYEITNKILPLCDIPEAKLLRDCITETPALTFQKLENTLLRLCEKTDLSEQKFRYIDFSVQEILKTKGVISIDKLVSGTGLSQRYFDTIFRQTVGINPKPFCNIIRLNHFINFKNTYPEKKLTECCYESGFFDQSHLIKTFLAVTNRLPAEYFRTPNLINNYFSEM